MLYTWTFILVGKNDLMVFENPQVDSHQKKRFFIDNFHACFPKMIIDHNSTVTYELER